MTLEELPVGSGLHICSFLDQQFHVLKAPSFNGDMQGRLTCDMAFVVTGCPADCQFKNFVNDVLNSPMTNVNRTRHFRSTFYIYKHTKNELLSEYLQSGTYTPASPYS